jgi:hypothetical protein
LLLKGGALRFELIIPLARRRFKFGSELLVLVLKP